MTPRSSCNADLLRKAQLAARESGGAFYAVLLDSPRTRFGKVQADALDDVILASYFGAKIVWLKSSDVVDELLRFARKTETGRIFVARRQPHPFLRPFGRSVYSQLLDRAEGVRIERRRLRHELIRQVQDGLQVASVDRAFRYFPVPLSCTVCGVPFALSVIVSVPVCLPAMPGVNLTEIEQLAPAARVAGQVLVCANTPVSEII